MAFFFLKRLFGSDATNNGVAPENAPAHANSNVDGDALAQVQNFVNYVVCALVDKPEEVRLESVAKGDLNIIQIHCFKRDIGKIIGKSGKTIAALRVLVSGTAAKLGFRATVDVMDD